MLIDQGTHWTMVGVVLYALSSMGQCFLLSIVLLYADSQYGFVEICCYLGWIGAPKLGILSDIGANSKKKNHGHVQIYRNWLWKCEMKTRCSCLGPQPWALLSGWDQCNGLSIHQEEIFNCVWNKWSGEEILISFRTREAFSAFLFWVYIYKACMCKMLTLVAGYQDLSDWEKDIMAYIKCG